MLDLLYINMRITRDDQLFSTLGLYYKKTHLVRLSGFPEGWSHKAGTTVFM